jgi:hypothetical protein
MSIRLKASARHAVSGRQLRISVSLDNGRSTNFQLRNQGRKRRNEGYRSTIPGSPEIDVIHRRSTGC